MSEPSDRDERREYEADVVYEVWRSGGDVNAIDRDRLDDSRYDGFYPEEAAARELRAHREATGSGGTTRKRGSGKKGEG